MDAAAVDAYRRRIELAESVRDLHQIAMELGQAYPADPDAEALDRLCWSAAERLIARGRGGARRRGGRGGGPSRDEGWEERAYP